MFPMLMQILSMQNQYLIEIDNFLENNPEEWNIGERIILGTYIINIIYQIKIYSRQCSFYEKHSRE